MEPFYKTWWSPDEAASDRWTVSTFALSFTLSFLVFQDQNWKKRKLPYSSAHLFRTANSTWQHQSPWRPLSVVFAVCCFSCSCFQSYMVALGVQGSLMHTLFFVKPWLVSTRFPWQQCLEWFRSDVTLESVTLTLKNLNYIGQSGTLLDA